MRKYNSDYTIAFRDKQLKWFEERMDKLPKSLQYTSFAYTADLPLTVRGLMNILRTNQPNVAFSGYMETLLLIKDKLQEQGL